MPKRDPHFLEKHKNNFIFKTFYFDIHHVIQVSCWWSSSIQHLLTDKYRLDICLFLICEEVNYTAHERV